MDEFNPSRLKTWEQLVSAHNHNTRSLPRPFRGNIKHNLFFSEPVKVSIWGKSDTSRSSFPSGGYWCQFVRDREAPALMWPHGWEDACRECSQRANESKNGRIEIYFRGKKENGKKKAVMGMMSRSRVTEGKNKNPRDSSWSPPTKSISNIDL